MTTIFKNKNIIITLILPLAALLEHGLFGIDIERREPLQLQIHPKLQTQISCNQPSTNLMPGVFCLFEMKRKRKQTTIRSKCNCCTCKYIFSWELSKSNLL